MSANVEAMVREGINAYRAGNKEEARTLLLKAVELDEQSEQAWLWLSAVVDTPEDQQTCLENVLMINPNNERAQQGLRILKQKTTGATPAAAQKSDEDAFANVSFTQTTPPPAPADDDELPSSVEWDMPATETSSPSSSRRVNEPTPADYDDWVAGLNLNTASGTTPAPPPPPVEPAFTSPFVMDNLGEDTFGFDEDPAIPESTSSAFASGGPFASFDDDLSAFEDDEDDLPRSSAAPSRMMSPTIGSPSLARDDDDFLADLDSDADFLEDYDQAPMGALDPSEFFSHIPPEIKATRLPGTKEREPILALFLLLVLLAANVGAVALLVMTLIS